MQKISEEEMLLNVQEAMEFLGISRSTIYRMIKRGDLKAYKVGAEWRFFKKDLIEFVKGDGNSPEEDGDGETT